VCDRECESVVECVRACESVWVSGAFHTCLCVASVCLVFLFRRTGSLSSLIVRG
jgi:hypothetical protein